jgi:hypothetical protein
MLVKAHLEDMDEVRQHMAWLIPMAAKELGVEEVKLFRRFLGWTLAKDAACRVCGKPGHDFIPGVPPRLIPCEGYAVEPVRRATKG